jgi:hypothetical protein
MITALASDAAIQASTTQVLKSQLLPTAAMPVTRNYSMAANNFIKGRDAFYAGIVQQEAMWWAGESGPVSSNSTSRITVSPFCSTGNCAFDLYQSLAFQHQCQDLSDTLQYSSESNTTSQNVTFPVSSELNYFTAKTELTANYTTWNVPWSDFNLSSTSFSVTMDSAGNAVGYSPMASVLSTQSSLSPITWNETLGSSRNLARLPLTEVFALVLNTSSIFDGSTEHFRALRCTLDLGMQTYTASVENGVLLESAQEFYGGNWTIDEQYIFSLTQYIGGVEYSVSIDLDSLSSLSMYLPLPSEGTTLNYWDLTANPNELANAVAMSALYSQPLDNLFDSIAQSLTDFFHADTDESVAGMTHNQTQYFSVQWEWLLVPLALVLANIAFVAAVRLQSHRRGVPGWRNSALALMLGGDNDDNDDTAAGVRASRAPSPALGQEKKALLLGPPASVNHNSELDAWAATKTVMLRRMGNRAGPLLASKNDALVQMI